MKTVMTAGINGKSFTIEHEAYKMLCDYMEAFRTKSTLGVQPASVMADLEERLAEIFSAQLTTVRDVVDTSMVSAAIMQLGMPDGTLYSPENVDDKGKYESQENGQCAAPATKRLYRDKTEGVLGGVCAGVGHYFNIDILIPRLVFLMLLICMGTGVVAYLILWIIIPKAKTAREKCEMRGLPLTPENISNYSI